VQSEHIIIIPGAGITHSKIAKVAEQTGAIEFHAGLGSVPPTPPAITPPSKPKSASWPKNLRPLIRVWRLVEEIQHPYLDESRFIR